MKAETRKTVVAIRDGEVKLQLPDATIRANGTIWRNGIPLLDGNTPGALSRADAVAAVKSKQWTDIPDAQYARLGTNAGGLIVRDAAEIEAEERAAADQARKDYDAANPGAEERRTINALYAHARQRRDASDDCNTMDYYRISAQADARLKTWREKYPVEALREQAAHLHSKADHQRSLASGALTYDCDGSLSSEMQQERHDEFAAKAVEYGRQAAEMLAQK